MASLVISWIMSAAIREEEKECVQPHCMHGAPQEEQCNACVVEYTLLGQHKSNRMTDVLDPQDHGCGSLHQMAKIMIS